MATSPCHGWYSNRVFNDVEDSVGVPTVAQRHGTPDMKLLLTLPQGAGDGRSQPHRPRVGEDVVMPRHDLVGDLVHLAHRLLRGADVVRVGQHLAGEEVLLRGYRVAGDEDR